MKNIIICLKIALMTFAFGIIGVYIYENFAIKNNTEKELRYNDNQKSTLKNKEISTGKNIKVRFVNREEENDFGYILNFQVTNYNLQEVHYSSRGKNKNLHCNHLLSTEEGYKYSGMCTCGNGINVKALLPEETVIFPIFISDKSKAIDQVGFTFDFGNGISETFWSECINDSEK
jgi:hypothetical protein